MDLVLRGPGLGSFVVAWSSPDALLDLTVDPLGEFILVGVRYMAGLWNWRGEAAGALETIGYKVLRVAISPDGARLLTVSDNPSGDPSHYAQLWDRQGRLLAQLEAVLERVPTAFRGLPTVHPAPAVRHSWRLAWRPAPRLRPAACLSS